MKRSRNILSYINCTCETLLIFYCLQRLRLFFLKCKTHAKLSPRKNCMVLPEILIKKIFLYSSRGGTSTISTSLVFEEFLLIEELPGHFHNYFVLCPGRPQANFSS